MAMRLRTVNGELMALCAAYSEEKQGDIYIDDGWNYAISQKYWRDYDEIAITDEKDVALAKKIEEET
ncbi:hypothetical protein LCGC14_2818460 [marine sediment metagenome]|uniref:Uncharacterized protein n=1 Tax=marine sediment metagenome TaxID=412755 RepID=A0A0F8YHT8_9ZZZZ